MQLLHRTKHAAASKAISVPLFLCTRFLQKTMTLQLPERAAAIGFLGFRDAPSQQSTSLRWIIGRLCRQWQLWSRLYRVSALGSLESDTPRYCVADYSALALLLISIFEYFRWVYCAAPCYAIGFVCGSLSGVREGLKLLLSNAMVHASVPYLDSFLSLSLEELLLLNTFLNMNY